MDTYFSMNFIDMMVMVADRVNAFTFKQLPPGSAVRIGGRLSAATDETVQLTTTDGGVLVVTGCTIKSMQESGLQWWHEDFGLNAGFNAGFVEIVGQKMSDSVVNAASLWPLGQNVDHALWEYALTVETSDEDGTNTPSDDTPTDEDTDVGILENAFRMTHLSQPIESVCAAPAA